MNHSKLYLATAALAAFFSTQAFAQEPPSGMPMPPFPMSRTITVLSTGTAGAAAKGVSLTMTVSSADQTATGLFVKQDDIVKHLKEALVGAGIKSEDITEQPFHLMPNMEYGQNGTRIIGYRMDTQLNVQLDHVEDLPRIIDLATQSGAGAINVGSFSAAPGESLHTQAVKSALDNARNEAASIAKEMGGTLGEIVSISETGPEPPGPMTPQTGGEEEERAMARKAQQPNTLSESANLKVVFAVN